MLETSLCLKAKVPKILSYIDEESGNYISLEVKLKDKVSEFELKKFLSDLKYLNVEFQKKGIKAPECVQKFKDNIKKILETDVVINLEKIYELFESIEWQEFLLMDEKLEEFFSKFEIVNKFEYSSAAYNEMIRQIKTTKLFMDQSSNFEEELKAMPYNSYFFGINYAKKKEQANEDKNKKMKLLVKEQNIG